MRAVVDDTTPRAEKTMGQILGIKGRGVPANFERPNKHQLDMRNISLDFLNG